MKRDLPGLDGFVRATCLVPSEMGTGFPKQSRVGSSRLFFTVISDIFLLTDQGNRRLALVRWF